MSEQKNLILAIVISAAILFGFQFLVSELYPPQQPQQPQTTDATTAPPPGGGSGTQAGSGSGAGSGPAGTTSPSASDTIRPTLPGSSPNAPVAPNRDMALEDAPRLDIRSDVVEGSLRLTGARFDDLILRNYRVTPEPDSDPITLLSPSGSPAPYFVEFGWVPAQAGIRVPDSQSVWQVEGSATALEPGKPVTLHWDNGEGLRFKRTITLDDRYLFTVEQTIENHSDNSVTLHPYALNVRMGTPVTQGFFILHEGLIGMFKGVLEEVDYDDIRDERTLSYETTGGWLGITDKYWLVSLLPDQNDQINAAFRHEFKNRQHRYQTDFLGSPLTVAPGGQMSTTSHLFSGPKELELLEKYEDQLAVPSFDSAIDFGWLYLITRYVIFVPLHFFNTLVGNYGVAIIIGVFILKLIFFPLANISYRSMSKLKQLQPELMEMRERHKDDKMAMNQAMMEMYKKHKVNPASGCLPILVQIPVFFALYKVLFVTIEMRHAPFFGWIEDLSAPDPTSVFNLFGLLPFDPPSFLALGAWPLIMGVSMWLQQKLNPAPADPMQAKIMMLLPIVFTFLLASFPAGLVIYWTVNNVLSIAQQYVIMRRMGVSIGGGEIKKTSS